MNTLTHQEQEGNKIPDLSIKTSTINLLTAIFAQGEELKPHLYPEVSEMLTSNTEGFFDAKYNSQ